MGVHPEDFCIAIGGSCFIVAGLARITIFRALFRLFFPNKRAVRDHVYVVKSIFQIAPS